MAPLPLSERARRIARVLIAIHGRRAEAIAIATAAALLENDQLLYSDTWQQVARAVTQLLIGDGGV